MNTFSNYQDFIDRLKKQIQSARIKAVIAANSELLQLYWWLGDAILKQQTAEGWGAKVISRIALDLKDAFPDMKGISERNLKYMRAFALAYPQFVQVSLAQMESEGNYMDLPKVQDPLAQITWYHHITLLDKIKDEPTRRFYIAKTIENGWSRDMMVNQIEAALHLRQGKIQHNFSNTLPAAKSDLAIELFKDPYKFDFFQLTQEANERELEDALVSHIYKFLLEMGKGFAFMGRQFHLEKGGQDYYLDLLFYHTKLRCHIILELKIGDFKPEYAGKMNFYLSAFDDAYRLSEDGPTIGIILCKSKNKVTAEYALRDVNKPMGIAEYNLTEAIPEDLKGELPSIEDLEEELEKELKITSGPVYEKVNNLKHMVGQLTSGEIKEKYSAQNVQYLFNDVLFALEKNTKILLEPIIDMFFESSINYSINGNSSFMTPTDLEGLLLRGDIIHQIGLVMELKGFKKDNVNTFNCFSSLNFNLGKFKYQVGDSKQSIWYNYSYDFKPSENDLHAIVERWVENIVDDITRSIKAVVN